mgnify:CR=1 FL=1
MGRLTRRTLFAAAILGIGLAAPVAHAAFIESNPIPVKAALAMMGMIEERYRLPMVPMSDKHRPKLKTILKDLGLL